MNPESSGMAPDAPGGVRKAWPTKSPPQCTRHLAAAGFRLVGHRAIRLDMLDRLEEELEKAAAGGAQSETIFPKLVSLLGCSNDELKDVLGRIGWRTVDVAGNGPAAAKVWRRIRDRQTRRRNDRSEALEHNRRGDSPFAELAALIRK